MARPRQYVQDANGKTVDGLSRHRASGRFYSITGEGGRRYWGRNKIIAIRRYRSSLGSEPTTAEEALELLATRGHEEWQVTPELLRIVKSNERKHRFRLPTDEWLTASPNYGIRLHDEKFGAPVQPDSRQDRPEVRSRFLKRGWLAFRRMAASCWLRARFSMVSSVRSRTTPWVNSSRTRNRHISQSSESSMRARTRLPFRGRINS